MNEPEDVQEPEHDDDNHDGVQNGLNTPSHGDETIYEPQKDTDDD